MLGHTLSVTLCSHGCLAGLPLKEFVTSDDTFDDDPGRDQAVDDRAASGTDDHNELPGQSSCKR